MYALEPGRPASFTFNGGFEAESAQRFVYALTAACNASVSEIHVWINCYGGNIQDAYYAYLAMRALDVPISIYNVGVCHSAAVTVFLGAEHRFATKQASFLIHPVKVPANAFVGETEATAMANECKIGNDLVDSVLSERVNIPPEIRAKARYTDVLLTSEEAKLYGIIHDIRAPTKLSGVPLQVIPATWREPMPRL